jgi:hypothetical protein
MFMRAGATTAEISATRTATFVTAAAATATAVV